MGWASGYHRLCIACLMDLPKTKHLNHTLHTPMTIHCCIDDSSVDVIVVTMPSRPGDDTTCTHCHVTSARICKN